MVAVKCLLIGRRSWLSSVLSAPPAGHSVRRLSVWRVGRTPGNAGGPRPGGGARTPRAPGPGRAPGPLGMPGHRGPRGSKGGFSDERWLAPAYWVPQDWVPSAHSALQKGLKKGNTFLSASDTFLWEPITKLAFPLGALLAGLTQWRQRSDGK